MDQARHMANSGQQRSRYCGSLSDVMFDCVIVYNQTELERLLQVFPAEEVESKRWQKIANSLGNRTAKQVIKI